MRGRVAELVGSRARLDVGLDLPLRLRPDPAARRSSRFGMPRTSRSTTTPTRKRLMTAGVPRPRPRPEALSRARACSNWVSNCKNELVDHEDGARAAPRTTSRRRFAEAYAAYQRRLRAANALDFDDLIMTTVHLLQAFPEVREHYRRRFRHVLVDEYQDTNHAQYVAGPRALRPRSTDEPTAPHRAAGADGGRRLRPVDLRASAARRSATSSTSRRTSPAPRSILLEQNYRSTQTILTAANAVIGRNAGRKPKNLWSDAGDGEQIVGLRRRRRARRGAVRRRGDRPAGRRGRGASPGTSRCSTAPTPSPGCSRRCSSASACRTRSSAACASTSAARSATRSPTCGCSPTPRRRLAAPDPERARSGGSATGPRPASRRSRSASGSRFWRGAAPGRRDRRAWPPGRPNAASAASSTLIDALEADGGRQG